VRVKEEFGLVGKHAHSHHFFFELL